MVFFTIFFALLFEQARPLGAHSSVHKGARAWVLQILRSFDTGQIPSAWLAWGLMVLLPALLTTVVHWLLLLQVLSLRTRQWKQFHRALFFLYIHMLP